jgi:putative AlgH/UPF0301 family transcriptional regulator
VTVSPGDKHSFNAAIGADRKRRIRNKGRTDSATRFRIDESVRFDATTPGEPVMSLRKLFFYATLAAILACAVVAGLSPRFPQSDAPNMSTERRGSSLAERFPAKGEDRTADFFPVQSTDAKNLGVGKLLVASRNIGDPQFAKSVILLVRYDAKGVLGLMLNRRTQVPLSRALDSLKGTKDRSDPVYLGGPVEIPAVFALFRSSSKPEGAEHVFDSLYLITTKVLLEQTISARPDASVFHVYLGYAGWSQEQLQQEVGLGAWFIFPAEASMVFNADPDSLWREMIRKTEMQFAWGKCAKDRRGRFHYGGLPAINPSSRSG